jgi:ABC-type branched-subunit amino acid transport system ATPase component
MLEVFHLSKHFGGISAVSRVSFSVAPGEVLACVGPNGAGKTTLINLITGWQTPDEGGVKINGESIDNFYPEVFAARGVVRTFQKARLFQSLTVLENLLLASRPWGEETLRATLFFRSWWRHNQKQAVSRAEEVLESLGISHLQQRNGDTLSGGEQRLVELAMAAMRRPRLLVLDEPVANLSPEAREKVAAFLLRQRAAPIACLLVEHDLSFVRRVADRVLVLTQGAVLGLGEAADPAMQEMMEMSYLSVPAPGPQESVLKTPSWPGGDGPARVISLPPPSPTGGHSRAKNSILSGTASRAWETARQLTRSGLLRRVPQTMKRHVPGGDGGPKKPSESLPYKALAVRGLSVDYGSGPVVEEINIDVRPGEIVALVGGNGAGKSTIIRAILGLANCRGSITLGEESLTSLQPYVISRLGVAYVSQHRKVFPSLTVLENLLLASELHHRVAGSHLDYALHTFPELKGWFHLSAGNLSGGQQQMVAITRALLAKPRLLLLDEPSAGLSDGLWRRLAGFLTELAGKGLPILLVEHRPSILNNVLARGYLIQRGRISSQGMPGESFKPATPTSNLLNRVGRSVT